jgi:Bacterial membrane protein YfhO
VLPLLAATVLVASPGWRRPRALGLATCALLLSARWLEASGLYPSCPAAALAPRLPVLDAVPRGAPVRTVAVGILFVPNVSALYELEDVHGYESLTLHTFRATYPLWCTPQGIWFNRVDDLEKPFLSFLNVGYALVPPGSSVPSGWSRRAEGRGADLLRNERCLSRAFVPEETRSAPDALQRLAVLEKISDFGARGVVDSGSPPGEWRRNGRATVSIEAYGGQSLDLVVDAQEESVVGTSITAWPGWRATLDGRPILPLEYDVAFLGFRVPAGRHRVSVRYVPAGVLYGGIASAMTAILCAGLLSRKRG